MTLLFHLNYFLDFFDLFYTDEKAMENGTILVLNMSRTKGWKPAVLINSAGGHKELACLKAEKRKTEAYNSCSVIWQNRLHIFGGYALKRQISQLIDHELQHIGELAFDHSHAACSVMNNQHIYLCFNSPEGAAPGADDYKRCRRSTGPLELFSEVASSNHTHRYTQISCTKSKFLC